MSLAPDTLIYLLRIAASAACLAVVAVAGARCARGRGSASGLSWLVVPACFLAAVLAFCLRGATGSAWTIAPVLVAATVTGVAATWRVPLVEKVDALVARTARPGLARGVVDAALLATCAVAAVMALELAWCDQPLSDGPHFLWLEFSLAYAALGVLYLFGQRRGGLVALGVGLAFGVGVTARYVLAFKGALPTPGDVLGAGTAADVMGAYTFDLSQTMVAGASVALAGIWVASLLSPGPAAAAPGPAPRSLPRVLANLALAGVLALGVGAYVTCCDLVIDEGVDLYYWDLAASSRSRGLVSTFLAEVQDLRIPEPEGFSPDSARDLEATYAAAYDDDPSTQAQRAAATAQFDEERPCVVAILCESYADLSIFDGLHAGYAGLGFDPTSTAGTLMSGPLYTSVYGGTTCNSEFEFLTGCSMANIGFASTPYAMWDLSGAPSLARQLGGLGYETTAIHPNVATNWYRDVVYPQLGFGDFLTIDDFEGAPQYHGETSDEAIYQRIIEILSTTEDPQFVFALTMQNHSGYDTGNVPAADLPDCHPTDYDDSDTNAVLNEYLACIGESDRALAAFVEALRGLDRPVVLVFYGDHQPYFTSFYNDALTDDAGTLDHQERLQETPWLVWANYDVAGWDASPAEKTATSLPFLGAAVLDAIGAPLTDYQKATMVLGADVRALNHYGYLGADGAWHEPGTGPAAAQEALADYARMEYLEFGSTVS